MTGADETETVDVLIAGAGPAASATAMGLSDSGMSVLMLEKKMEIGSPVICADMVNMSFPEMEALQADPRIIIRRLDSLRVRAHSVNGAFRMVPAFGDGDAFNSVVERDRLDKELASLALLKGARLQIRAELTGFEEIDGGIISTYRKGGRQKKVKSTALVIATGMETCSENGNSKCFSYRYGRRITREVKDDEAVLWPGGVFSSSIGRYPGERNSVTESPDGKFPDESTGGGQILTGTISRAFPDKFNPGHGRVIKTGSNSGLYNPFFRTGFREAFMSGRIAAEAILEDPQGDASATYARRVGEIMLGEMECGRKLAESLLRSSDEKISKFFTYLSGFELAEISAEEIFRKTGLNDSELEEML